MSVVVVGEALVDLAADDDDPTRFTAHPGGSPANVAVTLARLGTPVRFAGRLAGDGFGRLLRDHLSAKPTRSRSTPARWRSRSRRAAPRSRSGWPSSGGRDG